MYEDGNIAEHVGRFASGGLYAPHNAKNKAVVHFRWGNGHRGPNKEVGLAASIYWCVIFSEDFSQVTIFFPQGDKEKAEHKVFVSQ